MVWNKSAFIATITIMIMTSTVMFATMDDFIIRAIVGAVLVALICAPLGCIVVWKNMTYFGAALSHAALLGVAIGLLTGLPIKIAIILISMVVALLLFAGNKIRSLASDTILAILAHATLAIGLIALSLMPDARINVMSYLFGDVLTITWSDIAWIFAVLAISGLVLLKIWQPLLSTIVQPELARADGHSKEHLELWFLLLLSALVAVSMQVVGLLLIVSLLIIPVAAARPLASSPEQVVWGAMGVGVFSVLGGIWTSLHFDSPAGPSMVAVASFIFLVSAITSSLRRQTV